MKNDRLSTGSLQKCGKDISCLKKFDCSEMSHDSKNKHGVSDRRVSTSYHYNEFRKDGMFKFDIIIMNFGKITISISFQY